MNRFRLFAHVSTALLLAVAAGCARTEDTARDRESKAASEASRVREPEMAQVRFVNAYPGAVDLYFGDTPVFSGVKYKDVTPYKQVQEDWAKFKLRPAGKPDAEALATNMEAVGDGEYFTVIAVAKDDAKATLRAVQDDEEPAADKAKIRVVHAAHSKAADDIDFVVSGKNEPLFDGIDANSVSNYKEVDTMKAGFEIRPDNGKGALLKIPAANFAPGKLYTFVITDSQKKAALDVIKLTDRTDEMPTGTDRR
jgi:hypothetical protein